MKKAYHYKDVSPDWLVQVGIIVVEYRHKSNTQGCHSTRYNFADQAIRINLIYIYTYGFCQNSNQNITLVMISLHFSLA